MGNNSKKDKMKEIFICKIKMIGTRFAVLTEDEAKAWVADDKEMNYYETVPIKQLEVK
jgi:hypothetical protein